jgi:putative membrane protein
MSFILRLLGNSIALYLANLTVGGFVFNGSIREYIIASLFLTVLHFVVRPILKTILSPLVWITLGLFTLVINGAILWIVDYFLDFMLIENFVALLWVTVLVSVIGVISKIISK